MKRKINSFKNKLLGSRRFGKGAIFALCALLVIGIVPMAGALSAGMDVTIYPGVSIYVNDSKIDPKDANGQPVETFIYNGTTYLPVRAVSEALGMPVQWEGATSSVYVGSHSSDEPAAYMIDMDYYTGSSKIRTEISEEDNFGNMHYNCLTGGMDRSYMLNGQYSKMTGTLYQNYQTRSSDISIGSFFSVYGDGKLLYTYKFEESVKGFKPESFTVDLTGVLEMQVILVGGDWDRLHVGDWNIYT